MSSKTKIIVLHMKEVVYTILFLILAILFGVLLFFMAPEKTRLNPEKLPNILLESIALPFH